MADLKNLDTKSLVLDMTTNLSRIGNFLLKDNYQKAEYFANELEEYIKELEKRDYDVRIKDWVFRSQKIVETLREGSLEKKYIADDSFTSAVVLQNRAFTFL